MEGDAIRDILRQLASGPVETLDGLAGKLQMSRDLLEQMLLVLERGGYLEPLEPACGTHCEHCGGAEACRLLHGGRGWSLTARGRRAIDAG